MCLAAGVEASGNATRPERVKAVVLDAKLAASIHAVLAHAGRLSVAPGVDAVDAACDASWRAIHEDVPRLVALPSLASHPESVRTLRALGPLAFGCEHP